jgi:hypothetical protein
MLETLVASLGDESWQAKRDYVRYQKYKEIAVMRARRRMSISK